MQIKQLQLRQVSKALKIWLNNLRQDKKVSPKNFSQLGLHEQNTVFATKWFFRKLPN